MRVVRCDEIHEALAEAHSICKLSDRLNTKESGGG